jgi:glycosidase
MKPFARVAAYLLVTILLVACEGGEEATPTPAQLTKPATAPLRATDSPVAATPVPTPGVVSGTDGLPWWNDAVFYEVFVRSFYDSDGDGVGDINGLIEKLDYLNDGDPATTEDLGITGIWLMPVMESPSYHGYDVVDYYQIDQEYGTNEDFLRLMDEAHVRGIRVIVDLVLNHTSREHPWFEESTDASSERRDWYIWADEPGNYNGPWGQNVWHASAGGFYYGVFWEGMPDLNYNNPEVGQQMQDVTRFWLEDMGVDGFRLDAIKHLIEDGEVQENTDQTHQWFEDYFTYYKSVDPDTMAVGEVWSTTAEVVEYIGDEVDLAFEFDLAQSILNSANDGRRDAVAAAHDKVTTEYPESQYAVFITNHDQNRVFSQLSNDPMKARLAASLLLTSPGVPFMYYGEEIGMRGIKPDEGIRRPMQWTDDEGGGFTTGEPWEPLHQEYRSATVADQSADSGSLLSHYRALIHLRHDHEALRIGQWVEIEAPGHAVYAFLRFSDDEVILVLINLDAEAVGDYELSLASGPLAGSAQATTLYSDIPGAGQPAAPELNGDGGFSGYAPYATLPPQSTTIIQLVTP